MTMVMPDLIISSLGDYTHCPFSFPGLGRIERFSWKYFSIVNMYMKSPKVLVKVRFWFNSSGSEAWFCILTSSQVMPQCCWSMDNTLRNKVLDHQVSLNCFWEVTGSFLIFLASSSCLDFSFLHSSNSLRSLHLTINKTSRNSQTSCPLDRYQEPFPYPKEIRWYAMSP